MLQKCCFMGVNYLSLWSCVSQSHLIQKGKKKLRLQCTESDCTQAEQWEFWRKGHWSFICCVTARMETLWGSWRKLTVKHCDNSSSWGLFSSELQDLRYFNYQTWGRLVWGNMCHQSSEQCMISTSTILRKKRAIVPLVLVGAILQKR